MLIATIEARSEARKKEADRLRALAATDENAMQRLKASLLAYMQSTGRDKIHTDRFRFRFLTEEFHS
jgi:hypothetical protein